MVSIIIPNYNHSQFLEERIETVLNQTYRDFEVIIIDDCSSDNSRAIIEKYRHNEKISAILYNTKNSGSVYRQWKKGIELAKGEYTWIAESDDSSSPLFLEKILPLIVNNNTAMAFSDSMTIDEYGNEIPGWKTLIDMDINNTEYKVLDGNSFIKEKMIFGNR
ncbi:MAG: glycosyltransferase, partial [Treponema sp.]|nr:glycosyltransferase [Treponema sp.]